MTTNGSPLPAPDPPAPVRKLMVAVYVAGDVLLELEEVTDDELVAECARRGLFTDAECEEMLSGNGTDSGTENEMPGSPTIDELMSASQVSGLKQEPVRLTGPSRAKLEAEPSGFYEHNPVPVPSGKLISERAWEIATERENEAAGFTGAARIAVTMGVNDLAQAIDERLGREGGSP